MSGLAQRWFYTYAHRRVDTGEYFYIGKGFGRRAWSRKSRNQHWHNVVKKAGYKVQILSQWPAEEDAFEHEKHLIACGRRLGWPLVNATNGGEGPSGWRPTEEVRARMSAAGAGRKMHPDVKAKISAAHKGRSLAPEHAEKIRAILRARNATPEQRAATSAKKGWKWSPEARAKMSAAVTGKKRGLFSAEHRAKLSMAAQGRVASEESRRKMSEAKAGKCRAKIKESKETA